MAKKENPILDAKLRDMLNDSGFQRGLGWRGEKLKAVALARKKGIPDTEIFRQLKIAGLMDTTAKKIMQDAYYFEGSEISVEQIKTPKKEFESGSHPCWNCNKPIPLNLNFCSETCVKEYAGKRKKAQ